MSQAVFFRTHLLNNGIIAEYNKVKLSQYPTYLAIDNTRGIANGMKDAILITETDMRSLNLHFNYFHFNIEYFLLWAIDHYDYDYYWLIEYDVRFNGEWKTLFNTYLCFGSDLLATFIDNQDKHPDFWAWDTLSWELPSFAKWKVFFPIARFSRRALFHLRERYRQGFHGYCEVVVPTILINDGFVVQDLNLVKTFYNQDTWKWQPNKLKIVQKFPENHLFHPVHDDKTSYNVRRSIFL